MSLTFNGINSDSMGLFVEKYPERPFPSRKQSVYGIKGRSGDLIIDENAFSNVTQTYEVYIKGGSAGFQAKASAIAHWLLSPSGYARLTDSYDTTVYRKARFTGGVSFLNSLNKYGKATITFDCCPQRYPVTVEKLTGVLGDTFTIPTVSGIMDGYPLIVINGWITYFTRGSIETDTLSIDIPRVPYHGQGVIVTPTTITIDFEERTIIDGDGYVVDGATITGTWDAVGSGETIVTTLTEHPTGYATPTIELYTRRWYL